MDIKRMAGVAAYEIGKLVFMVWMVLVHIWATYAMMLWIAVPAWAWPPMPQETVWLAPAIIWGPTLLLSFALWGWRWFYDLYRDTFGRGG